MYEQIQNDWFLLGNKERIERLPLGIQERIERLKLMRQWWLEQPMLSLKQLKQQRLELRRLELLLLHNLQLQLKQQRDASSLIIKYFGLDVGSIICKYINYGIRAIM
jgi:hypothetical protein